MIYCPICRKEMVEENFGGVMVDVCKEGCKGMWFDWNELSKLDEDNEGVGEALREALEYPRSNDEYRPRLNCPKCGIPMQAHKYKAVWEVNIDECYACGGIFLDSGELKVIRQVRAEEREAYLQKLLTGTPEIRKAKRDLEKRELRAKALRNLSRILTSRAYPGGW